LEFAGFPDFEGTMSFGGTFTQEMAIP
jgi:hypothetical protein